MTKKRTLDPEMIDSVAQNMFYALPLIKSACFTWISFRRSTARPSPMCRCSPCFRMWA